MFSTPGPPTYKGMVSILKEMSDTLESLDTRLSNLESRTPPPSPEEHLSFLSNGELVTIYKMSPMQVDERRRKSIKSQLDAMEGHVLDVSPKGAAEIIETCHYDNVIDNPIFDDNCSYNNVFDNPLFEDDVIGYENVEEQVIEAGIATEETENLQDRPRSFVAAKETDGHKLHPFDPGDMTVVPRRVDHDVQGLILSTTVHHLRTSPIDIKGKILLPLVHNFIPLTTFALIPLPSKERVTLIVGSQVDNINDLHEWTRSMPKGCTFHPFEPGGIICVHLRKEQHRDLRISELSLRGTGSFKVISMCAARSATRALQVPFDPGDLMLVFLRKELMDSGRILFKKGRMMQEHPSYSRYPGHPYLVQKVHTQAFWILTVWVCLSILAITSSLFGFMRPASTCWKEDSKGYNSYVEDLSRLGSEGILNVQSFQQI